MSIAEFRDVSHIYTNGEHQLKALDGVMSYTERYREMATLKVAE